jgi:hypothetical protein
MSFLLSCFSEIIEKYPSWESLSAYLTSEEGGSLRIIQPADSALALIRYTKNVSKFDVPHVPFFRSVVWSKTSNRPMCVAPVQAQEDPIPEGVDMRVSDFVDGTMVNAWKSNGIVGIATRSSLGGNTKFYSTRSFADLFNDALKGSGGSYAFLDSVLNDGEFASFVLQHREHKIVGPIVHNRVFVTHFGSVNAEDGRVLMSSANFPDRLLNYLPELIGAGMKFTHGSGTTDNQDGSHSPRPLGVPVCGQELMQEYASRGYTWQGLVFQEIGSSRRWRMRNPEYTYVRRLRGSEASPFERFLRLRADGDVKKYLTYFREENKKMWELEQFLRTRTLELYTAYTEMNKLKQKTMRDLMFCLRPHVYALHGVYLKSLKDGAEPITKDVVIGYVNELSVEEQMKLLG